MQTQPTNRFFRCRLALCVLALTVLALAACFPPGDGRAFPRLALFFGRFHPVLLHLPIGFLLLAGVFEVAAFPWFGRWTPVVPAAVGRFATDCAAAAAVVTAVSGWLLSQGGGYDPDLLRHHFVAGLVTAFGAILTVGSRLVADAHLGGVRLQRLPLVLLLATNLTLVLAADYGGSITHGRNYLTEYAPDPLRRLLGLPVTSAPAWTTRKPLSERIIFQDVVRPILAQHCLACHNEEKQKAGLRLDRFDLVLKGDPSGPVVEPGHPERSELVRRLQLPEEDEDHMPPAGIVQPTADGFAPLTWWVKAGAPERGRVRDLAMPDEVRHAVEALDALPSTDRRTRSAPGQQNQRSAAPGSAAQPPYQGSRPAERDVLTGRADRPNG